MRVSLIAAISKNGVIGAKNRLPWNLPEDLKRFRSITSGKPVIMGRKTFESIGRLLPNRWNVIISRQSNLIIPGATVVGSLSEAIESAKSWCRSQASSCEEVFVIGGATIYAEALPWADRLYLTRIDQEFEGDAYFPAWDVSQFREISREDRSDPIAHSYLIYERIS